MLCSCLWVSCLAASLLPPHFSALLPSRLPSLQHSCLHACFHHCYPSHVAFVPYTHAVMHASPVACLHILPSISATTSVVLFCLLCLLFFFFFFFSPGRLCAWEACLPRAASPACRPSSYLLLGRSGQHWTAPAPDLWFSCPHGGLDGACFRSGSSRIFRLRFVWLHAATLLVLVVTRLPCHPCGDTPGGFWRDGRRACGWTGFRLPNLRCHSMLQNGPTCGAAPRSTNALPCLPHRIYLQRHLGRRRQHGLLRGGRWRFADAWLVLRLDCWLRFFRFAHYRLFRYRVHHHRALTTTARSLPRLLWRFALPVTVPDLGVGWTDLISWRCRFFG